MIDQELNQPLSPEAQVITVMMTRPHTKGIVLDKKFFRLIESRIFESAYLQELFEVAHDKKISIKGYSPSCCLWLREIVKHRPEDTLAGLCGESLLYVIPKDTPDNVRVPIQASVSGGAAFKVIEHD